jgi:predicted NUDIX family NTP pyrophosphohydrolase
VPKLSIGDNGVKLINGHVLIKERPEKAFDYIGGKMEEGESPEEAMIREIKEETGLEPINLRYLGVSAYKGGQTYMFTAEQIDPSHKIPHMHYIDGISMPGRKGKVKIAPWVSRIFQDAQTILDFYPSKDHSHDISKADIIFAFPGSGKTFISRMNDRYIDLDEGEIRTKLNVEKGSDLIMYVMKLAISHHIKAGKKVLTNYPELVKWCKEKQFWVAVFVPSLSGKELAGRLYNRDKDSDFTKMVYDNGDNWMIDWEEVANNNGVRLYSAKYLADLFND